MKVSIHRFQTEGKIIVQHTAKMAIVTINRPGAKNAMSAEMWQALAQIGKSIPKRAKTKVVVLRGYGKQFTAGSDIKEFHRMTIEEADGAFELMEEAISTFEEMPLPTIAMINGPAMGAGLELALACDLRVGSSNSRLGIPIGRLGITLSPKFAQRLVRLIGPSRTKDLIFTGRIFEADRALELGMLDYLVQPEELDAFTFKLAQRITAQSPATIKAAKEAVAICQPLMDIPWKSRQSPFFVDKQDFPEGVASFVEKRSPKFM
jgi:enoyl-CoA hydratase/carnithine racemase